jgi:hypothetical protein
MTTCKQGGVHSFDAEGVFALLSPHWFVLVMVQMIHEDDEMCLTMVYVVQEAVHNCVELW